jgi:hypothetical protein
VEKKVEGPWERKETGRKRKQRKKEIRKNKIKKGERI